MYLWDLTAKAEIRGRMQSISGLIKKERHRMVLQEEPE